MKITQIPSEYKPVTITLETERELIAFREILQAANYDSPWADEDTAEMHRDLTKYTASVLMSTTKKGK